MRQQLTSEELATIELTNAGGDAVLDMTLDRFRAEVRAHGSDVAVQMVAVTLEQRWDKTSLATALAYALRRLDKLSGGDR